MTELDDSPVKLPEHLEFIEEINDEEILVYNELQDRSHSCPRDDFGPSETQEILEEYELVRLSGECNMFDKSCVQRIAYELECYALVVAIEDELYPDILEAYDPDRVSHVEPLDEPVHYTINETIDF